MTYAKISQSQPNKGELEWGLFQEKQEALWHLAFNLSNTEANFYGITELFDSNNTSGQKLCILPFLGMKFDGIPEENNLPENPNPCLTSYNKLGIEINNASLSIVNAVLSLKLNLRLDITKSWSIELGIIEVKSEAKKSANVIFQCAWNDKIFNLPIEEIRLPFEPLDLGFLFRLRPAGSVRNIIIDLKSRQLKIPEFDLEMGLICPLPQGENKLQLSSPDDRILSLNCKDLTLPLDENHKVTLTGNQDKLMTFPGLCPNLGTLFDKKITQTVCLVNDWFIQKKMLTGVAELRLSVNDTKYCFPVDLEFDLEKGCLKKSKVSCTLSVPMLIDLGLFAIEILPYEKNGTVIGYFDLTSGDFWINQNDGKVQAYIPGDFKSTALNDAGRDQRFLFDLVRPKKPLDPGKSEAIFLLGASGLSLFAKQNTHKVKVNASGNGSKIQALEPLEKSGGINSVLEIRRNRIDQATFFAKTELPGFSDKTPIKVLAEIGLRQQDPKKPAELIAGLQVEKADGKPLATLLIGPLDSQVDELRMKLTWEKGDGVWELDAEIDGRLWLNPSVKMPELTSGLSKEKPACFEGLKLNNLRNDLKLRLSEAPKFELLNGMFGLSSETLSFKKPTNNGETLEIIVEKAKFSFKSDSPVEVDVQPGGLKFIFGPEVPKFLLCPIDDKPITLTARLGPSVKVSGQIQWIDNSVSQLVGAPAEKGIGVAGSIEITGLPPIRAAMYFGVGQKKSGETALSIFLYAETDIDVQLYPGVYLKSIGAGMGINRGLAAIGLNPTPEKILPQLNTLKPGELDAWRFIPEQQFYLSLVASILVGSVAGDQAQVSPYLLWMLLSIDSEGNFTAAAKLWLSSSPKYIREGDNFSRPAAEAVLVILPQQRLLSMRVITKQNPAIEKDTGIKKILDRSRIQFSYFMSPSLLDFYLEEASFSTEWIGLNWFVSGTFRTAIASFGAMTKAGVMASANFYRELGGSSAGASFETNLVLSLEMAGLVSAGQACSYAVVSASMAANAKLWLRISFKLPIIGKVSRCFSKSKRINAALAGTMGFDSSGEAGIAGSIDIETSICGHDCSISGRFNVKEKLVQEVRSKVGLFEKRLKAHKIRVSGVKREFILSSEPKWSEEWIIHRHDQWLLLLPTSRNRSWLGQLDSENKDFKNRLTKVKVFRDDPDSNDLLGEVEIKNLLERDGLSDKELSDEDEQQFIGSCQQLHPELINNNDEDWLKGVLLQDQRVRGESRNYWKEEDQERLADGVLPLDFRNLEDVEAAGMADAWFEEVFVYHYLNQRANRVSRHSLRQIDPHNAKVLSLRGLVSQEALRLLASEQHEMMPEYLPFINIENGDQITSFKVLLTTRIQQAGDNESYVEKVNEVYLKLDPLNLDKMSLGPPRQRCVVDNDKPYLEIKLPIIIDTTAGQLTDAWSALGELLHRIDSFEVYRQLPGEKEPTLLADNLMFSFRKVRARNPLDEQDQEQNFVILDPYLFTDCLELEWAKQDDNQGEAHLGFKNPLLNGLRLPEVVYEVRVKPLSVETSTSKATATLPLPCGSRKVPLQILPPPPGLGDLVAKLPVSALRAKNPLAKLMIGRMNGQEFIKMPDHDPVFAKFNGVTKPEVENKDFEKVNYLEIWIEESKVDGGGFFAEEMPLRDPIKPESVEDLKAAIPAQSRRRKTKIGRWTADGLKDNQGGDFKHNSFILRNGYAYRIFVGHCSDGPWKGLLTELPCALQAEKSELGLKFSHTIERIPELLSALLTRDEFDVCRTSNENNILELRVKPFNTALLGGFEVFIRDRDESHLSFRLEREMIDSRYFPTSQMDSRNSALWEAADDPSSDSSNSPDPTPVNNYMFYLDTDNHERKQLMQAAGQLRNSLADNNAWPELYKLSQEFWSAVWDYQRTAAYVNSHDPWELLKYRFRFLFIGLDLPDPKTLENNKLEDLANKWSEFTATLVAIETTDVAGLSDEAFDDFEIAAQMAAICRHRQEIAEELFGNADSEVPVIKGDADSKLPGKVVWPKKKREGVLSIKLDNFFKSEKQNDYLSDLLGNGGNEKTIEAKVLDDAVHIKACVAHSSDLSNLLYALKEHLKKKNWELVKRPHHTVQTTLEGSKRFPVETKAEYLLPQNQQAPERARIQNSQTDHIESQDANQLASHTPIYLANLLERLGFAIDIAAYDALGQPVNAKLLDKELQEVVINLKSKLQGETVVWLPQENRGPYPNNPIIEPVIEPAYYGFLKVAVVPYLEKDCLKELAIQRKLKIEDKEIDAYLIPGIKYILNYPKQKIHPIGERWLSLCSTGGNTISYWDGYDNKRRVFEVVVRPMSRYERLLRWAGLDLGKIEGFIKEAVSKREIRTVRHFKKDPFSPPGSLALGSPSPDAELLKPLPVYVHPHPSRIQFSYALPAEGARALMNNLSAIRSGWRGVEIALHHQELHRDDKPYSDFKTYLNSLIREGHFPAPVVSLLRQESLENPKVMELTRDISEHEVELTVDDTLSAALANADSHFLLIGHEIMKISGINDTKKIIVFRSQFGTSSASHKSGTAIQLLTGEAFSLAMDYELGSDLITLKLSQNSTTPTAYCYLSVDDEIFWVKAVDIVEQNSGNPDDRSIRLLVEFGQLGTMNVEHKKLTKETLLLLPATESSRLRLFRNERLISSAHLPYCLRYSMSCRVHYEYQPGKWISDKEETQQTATREPARISRWTIVTNPQIKNKCIIVLSRFWDLLTAKEQAQYRALPDLEQQSLPSVAYLPDPSLIYDLYYYHPQPSENGLESNGGVFLHLQSLLMPLAPGAPINQDELGKPYLLKKDEKDEYVPITVSGTTPTEIQFQVTVPFKVPAGIDEQTFDLSQLRLVVRRGAFASTLRQTSDTEYSR